MEKKTNSLALGALVISAVGIFIGLFGIVPLVGILFSISALMSIDPNKENGKGLAILALILGIIGLIWAIAFTWLTCSAMCSSFRGL